MAFVRKRRGGGKHAWKEGSHQLVEFYRKNGKVRQRQIANMGPWDNVPDAVADLEQYVDRLDEKRRMWESALDRWNEACQRKREEHEKLRAKRSHWLIVTEPPEKTRITDPRWSHGQIFVSGNKVKKQAEQWRKRVAKERANLNALRAYQATLPDLYAEPVSAPSSNPAA